MQTIYKCTNVQVEIHSRQTEVTTLCYIEINFKRKMDNRIYRHASAISLLLILLAFAGCNRNKETEDKMNMADSLMSSRPDSALAILSKIDTTLLSSRELRARYALLKSMALDKNYIDTTSFITKVSHT